MRLLLVALLLSSCTGDCSGVGAVGSMRAGDMQHGAARGAMAVPVDGDDAPVGVQWTIPPVFEYAAYLESGADNDPIETPACRGTLCSTLALTQGTLASRPTLRTACPVGATTKPCYRLDGGDWVEDTIARAILAFMHNGNGATCLAVWETSAAGQQLLYGTGDTAGGAPGANTYLFTTAVNTILQNAASSAFTGSGAVVGANVTYAHMFIDLVADTPDTSAFVNDFTTAVGTSSLGTRSAADPLRPLGWGGNWGGSGSFLTGYMPIPVVCWDQRLTTAEREAEQINLETYFGGAFPL